PTARRIFQWAKRVGERWAAHRLAGVAVPLGLKLTHAIADRLVFSKLRARTGGRIKLFVSGGAPLSAEIGRFFYSAGLPVIEGYGLTETSPVLTLNPLQRPKFGTVGKPIPGVQIRIAADGEILAKGANIMQGYHNKPAETREAIDAEGWFHTGDIGELDADGYLKITDRKKDLLKTAGGKYIAPQPIENAVRLNKFVASAVVLGDQRKFPIILIVPNYDQLERWAKERNLTYASPAELIRLADDQAVPQGQLREPGRRGDLLALDHQPPPREQHPPRLGKPLGAHAVGADDDRSRHRLSQRNHRLAGEQAQHRELLHFIRCVHPHKMDAAHEPRERRAMPGGATEQQDVAARAGEIEQRLERLGIDRERAAESGTGRCAGGPREMRRAPYDGIFLPAYRAAEDARPDHPSYHFARGQHEESLLVRLRAARHLRQLNVHPSRTPPMRRDSLRRAPAASSAGRPPPPRAYTHRARHPTRRSARGNP